VGHVERARRRAAAFLVLLGVIALPRPAAPAQIDTERATLYFDDGALTPAEAARFAHLVDQGIADIESYLWPAAPGLREGRITYRIRDDLPYSMTRGRTVSLMLERVRTDSAPYLHETVHVLVPSHNRSVWITEGFASYVESYVSENIGGYDAHVFSRTGNRGVDGEALRWLSRDAGRVVLPYVGAPGQPEEMLSERRRVAAPLYVMSQSFAKFLVDRIGLARVMALVSARDPESELAQTSGRPVESWKKEWLATIGMPGMASGPSD
jgi:hypothetical protein